MIDNLEAAVAYAAAGWDVFPCRADKAPMLTNGFKGASSDPELVTRWWKDRPGALIGAAIPENGLVIDLDPRNGCDVEQFLDDHDLPADEQAVSLSGRHDGGMHLFFTRPPGVALKGSPAPGVDVKAGGTGYVIVPPSVHPATGYEYCWLPDRPHVHRAVWTVVPDSLLNVIERRLPSPAAQRALNATWGVRGGDTGHRVSAFEHRIVVGGTGVRSRNDALYQAVQRAHRENWEGDWEGVFRDAALRSGLLPRAVEATIRSAKEGVA